MPSWRLPVPWKSSSWRPLAPPNWTTTWFSTIPTVSDILQIPCIFAAASATALLSAISFHLLHLFFQRNRMPTLFIVKCCIAANRRRTWGTRFSIYLFLSPRSFLFDFCFCLCVVVLLNLFFLYFYFLFRRSRHIRRDLHLHVRSGKERELCGLLSDPQRFVLSRERTTQRGDGTPIDDLPDEEPWRDDHRQTRTQPHALLAQR